MGVGRLECPDLYSLCFYPKSGTAFPDTPKFHTRLPTRNSHLSLIFAQMKFLRIFIVFAALLFITTDAEAQCAMCKAVAETGSHDGHSVSGGINNAILYLMVLPYILLFLLFRKKIVGFYREWKAMWK